MNTREPRKDLAKKKLDMSQPFDLSVLGTDDDPCFGKLFDIVHPDCKNCGDIDFCAIKFAANQKRSPKTDIETTIKKLLKKYKGDKTKVRRAIKKEFNLTSKNAKGLINEVASQMP